ncbi:unnamed protein product [Mytilus coruscus]|uniref:THAP-type domain-containing protein n=1 Tax=Mytilus coruscus TaxID=42192 RepID=A0A6J8CKT9_MYTCO|nr:unnamed protein product [Mytilus coruscus]
MAAMSEDEKDFLELSKMGKGSDQHCCVPNCNSNGRRHQVSFHRFPQVGARRNSWIQAIRRDPGPLFNINAYTFVCSLHFIREDFKWTPVTKTLKADAVPTVFSRTRDFTPRRELFKHITTNKKPKLQSENETLLDSISEEVNQEEDIQESEEQLRNPRFSNDDAMIMFYIGFSTYALFLAFFDYVQPATNSMTSYYYKATGTINLSVSRQRTMVLIDELFMFLCRLKCGLFEQDLACRFNVHVSTVSRKLITWSNFLYFVLDSINIWPTRKQIQNKMPQVFKTLYPTTRVIIDCTEIPTERPSSLALNSKCYSTYQSTHTFKSLVGIVPHGALIFISSLYTGSMSDVEITKLCGLVEL